jgi:hypothetical protein
MARAERRGVRGFGTSPDHGWVLSDPIPPQARACSARVRLARTSMAGLRHMRRLWLSRIGAAGRAGLTSTATSTTAQLRSLPRRPGRDSRIHGCNSTSTRPRTNCEPRSRTPIRISIGSRFLPLSTPTIWSTNDGRRLTVRGATVVEVDRNHGFGRPRWRASNFPPHSRPRSRSRGRSAALACGHTLEGGYLQRT